MRTCEICSREVGLGGSRGRMPRFCSNSCRQKAYRQRSKTAFPEVMTQQRRWVRADGKRPITVQGSPASTTNPSTWARFEDVRTGAGDGYGIMLGGGLGCYDLDHMSDEQIAAFLTQVQEPVLFVERSVSGEGAHIFIEAAEDMGWRRGNVERYTRARFIRVTGSAL